LASVSGFSFLAETIETLPTHPKPGVSKQKPAKPFLFITLQGRKHTHTHTKMVSHFKNPKQNKETLVCQTISLETETQQTDIS
jgi:signal recognition particle GTPase